MGSQYDIDQNAKWDAEHPDPTPSPDTIEELAAKAVMSELIHLAVRQAMLDAWNDICADTDCHPLDITRHGRKLEFQPRHWADHTAAILERLTNSELVTLSARNRELEDALKPFDAFLDGLLGFAGKPQSGEFHTISYMKNGVEEIRSITIEDFKAARAARALSKTTDGEQS